MKNYVHTTIIIALSLFFTPSLSVAANTKTIVDFGELRGVEGWLDAADPADATPPSELAFGYVVDQTRTLKVSATSSTITSLDTIYRFLPAYAPTVTVASDEQMSVTFFIDDTSLFSDLGESLNGHIGPSIDFFLTQNGVSAEISGWHESRLLQPGWQTVFLDNQAISIHGIDPSQPFTIDGIEIVGKFNGWPLNADGSRGFLTIAFRDISVGKRGLAGAMFTYSGGREAHYNDALPLHVAAGNSANFSVYQNYLFNPPAGYLSLASWQAAQTSGMLIANGGVAPGTRLRDMTDNAITQSFESTRSAMSLGGLYAGQNHFVPYYDINQFVLGSNRAFQALAGLGPKTVTRIEKLVNPNRSGNRHNMLTTKASNHVWAIPFSLYQSEAQIQAAIDKARDNGYIIHFIIDELSAAPSAGQSDLALLTYAIHYAQLHVRVINFSQYHDVLNSIRQ